MPFWVCPNLSVHYIWVHDQGRYMSFKHPNWYYLLRTTIEQYSTLYKKVNQRPNIYRESPDNLPMPQHCIIPTRKSLRRWPWSDTKCHMKRQTKTDCICTRLDESYQIPNAEYFLLARQEIANNYVYKCNSICDSSSSEKLFETSIVRVHHNNKLPFEFAPIWLIFLLWLGELYGSAQIWIKYYAKTTPILTFRISLQLSWRGPFKQPNPSVMILNLQ